MKTFAINTQNAMTAHPSDVCADEGVVKFQMEQELGALAATWPGNRLVEIWNKLKGVTPIAKFKDRKTALTRIWNAIQQIEPVPAAPRKPKAPIAKRCAQNRKHLGKVRPVKCWLLCDHRRVRLQPS